LKTPKTLFLAWQDPISRYWFSIGRLTFDGRLYQFVYTQGVKEAEAKCAFKPLSSFPCLDKVYTSTQLFPVFANRLMSRSRPDYSSFMEWLNIPNDEHDPMTILARSGGERETDTLAVFPCLEVNAQGQYHFELIRQKLNLEVQVERVNKAPTPFQFRLLCKMTVQASYDYHPFSSRHYQPLMAELARSRPHSQLNC